MSGKSAKCTSQFPNVPNDSPKPKDILFACDQQNWSRKEFAVLLENLFKRVIYYQKLYQLMSYVCHCQLLTSKIKMSSNPDVLNILNKAACTVMMISYAVPN